MMRFFSTNAHNAKTSLRDAVLDGLAPDGGLFMPEQIGKMEATFFNRLETLTLPEISFEVAKHLLQNAIPESDLKDIVEKSITFDAPLVRLSEQISALELFHGPTLSFKDFGARFMARLTAYLIREQQASLNILVATSGDTGSAVAHGFLDVPKIKVWILYPKGQVSLVQEKQLTTMGHNVTALAVEGTFDDCQSLVKQAFNDKELRKKTQLSSANSINIARLIPQSFYYFYAYAQLKASGQPVVFSVPSGNFGNLTAGLLAKKMGLPVERFVAATNINDSVPTYLRTGNFQPHPSKQTLSNAMDVGNPSNFARILDLYGSDLAHIRDDIFGISFTDAQTKSAIREIHEKYDYIADPHGAVAYLGLIAYQKQVRQAPGIFLETAHPAKFGDTVEPLLGEKVAIPARLQEALNKACQGRPLPNHYEKLRELLAASGKVLL